MRIGVSLLQLGLSANPEALIWWRKARRAARIRHGDEFEAVGADADAKTRGARASEFLQDAHWITAQTLQSDGGQV